MSRAERVDAVTGAKRPALSRRHLLALAGAGLAVAACARAERPTLVRLREDGVARVGVSGEQPFSYVDPAGAITGQSPEVARAVLAGLGVTGLVAVQLPFDELIDGLLDDDYDVLAAGLTITPERCARVAFSRPDFVAPTALLVPEGNPLGLDDLADVAVAGVPVAVIAGSVEQAAALAAGVPEAAVRAYDGQLALVRAVADGSAAAGALTAISLRAALDHQPGSGLALTPGFVAADGRSPAGGFAFRPADAALRTAFDDGLTALHRSGEWLAISERFGFTEDNEPPPGLRTEELCRSG